MRKFDILIFVLIFACTAGLYAGENLVTNPDFEAGAGVLPDGWEPWQWLKEKDISVITWETNGAQSGSRCISIENKQKNDARVKQTIQVKENKKYRLACWLKTENIGMDSTGAGITILYRPESSPTVKGTTGEWQQVEMYAQTATGVSSLDISLSLGGHGGENTGKAWFDNIVVEEVDQIPTGAVVANVSIPGQTQDKAESTAATGPAKASTPLVLLLVVLAVAIVAGAVLLNIFGKKKKAQAK